MDVLVKETQKSGQLYLYDINNCECTADYCNDHMAELEILFKTNSVLKTEYNTNADFYVNELDDFKEIAEVFTTLQDSINMLAELKKETGIKYTQLVAIAEQYGIDTSFILN